MSPRDKLRADAQAAAEEGPEAVLAVLADVIDTQADDTTNAAVLAWILRDGVLPPDETARLLAEIVAAHGSDDDLVVLVGHAMEAARDIDDLNAAPPENPLFATVVARLSEIQLAGDPETEAEAADALATCARLMGRQKDDLAERAYARLVELYPEADWAHYGQGLFYKTRGRFEEGVAANQRAMELAREPHEAHQWNLGICATGADQADVALSVWLATGNTLKIGRFGLPEGGYPACKVQLAAHPLAERTAETDDPGLTETIWVERLSPCHGIVRSVLFEDLGVDYGDVILFDGAPITYHKYGEKNVAVFPHLATLRRPGYRFYDFSATQTEAKSLENADESLSDDAVIYSHTENFQMLCATCWRDDTVQHERHDAEEHQVVHGRIAAPPDMPAEQLLAEVDNALASKPGVRLFAPDLVRAAGHDDRARLEDRRFATLRGDAPNRV